MSSGPLPKCRHDPGCGDWGPTHEISDNIGDSGFSNILWIMVSHNYALTKMRWFRSI